MTPLLHMVSVWSWVLNMSLQRAVQGKLTIMYTQCLRWRRAREDGKLQCFQHHCTAAAFHLPTWNEAMLWIMFFFSLVNQWSANALLNRLSCPLHMLDMYLAFLPAYMLATFPKGSFKSQDIGGPFGFLSDQWRQFGFIGVNGNTWCATRMSWSVKPDSKVSQYMGGGGCLML